MSVDYGSSSTADAISANLTRSGTIVDRRLTNVGAQVRVTFPDRNVTSDWLPVAQQGSAGSIFYYCPRVGDNVLVSHMSTGIEMGTVIATNPTPNNPSFKPRSINAVACQTDDKAYFEHDPDTGCFSINGVATIYVNSLGQIQIIAGGDVDVTTKANLNVTVSGNLVANVSGSVTATISGDLTANVSGTASVTASQIDVIGPTKIIGPLTIQGNITHTGNMNTTGVHVDSNGVHI